MRRGAVANMLLTSCLDNICRLWVETMLPDDGLLNMQHLDPLVTQNPKYGQHRHKRRLVERLQHMRKSFRRARTQGQHDQQPSSTGVPSSGTGNTLAVKKEPVPTLPSSYSVHDFHKVGVHGTGVSPECHFHLAASINAYADTDIPLVPLFSSGSLRNSLADAIVYVFGSGSDRSADEISFSCTDDGEHIMLRSGNSDKLRLCACVNLS
ncbi:dmX-like protein 2 [Paramacrobiotus metropolitanus]|uniref:dmX-like protein 2 n=1 Tax=Paramacrobiotus metropolitanus TaxID=2943436 RepID=UPI00244573C7|nr:dmX-like protein 2 [Paramacrobiotus metropolitanus]XP_055346408.1 dmX-like protein 2 [Paramacrobiotus metropolitanus]